MVWSKESREKQSNRFLNPFKVVDYRGVVIGVYKNSVEAEREGGFQSNAIRQVLNGRDKSFKRISIEDYLDMVGEE